MFLLDTDYAVLLQRGGSEELRTKRVRVGTMDLRIASIALSRDFTVLTRNLVDFQQVPGLRVEDWATA